LEWTTDEGFIILNDSAPDDDKTDERTRASQIDDPPHAVLISGIGFPFFVACVVLEQGPTPTSSLKTHPTRRENRPPVKGKHRAMVVQSVTQAHNAAVPYAFKDACTVR